MGWKETDVVSERLRFIHRLQAGERMTDLCREFGISRKTGYKIKRRFEELGSAGVQDESRAPYRRPHTTSQEIVEVVLALKKQYPTWGAKKLVAEMPRRHPGVHVPAASTVGLILKKHGLVKPRRRRKNAPLYLDRLARALGPNDVWCADFKGQFRLKNNVYCYPLTITDQYSRFILACEALESTRTPSVRAVFEAAFDTYGLPRVVRTDNGAPFASRGIGGLSQLGVWLLKQGVVPERIEPGHPEQNGRHERMHLTLKQETTRPAGDNMLQQQERFDRFLDIFNNERPHEALDMKRPADLYSSSNRQPQPPSYPLFDDVIRVRANGDFRLKNWTFYLGITLGGEDIGVRQLTEDEWLLSFACLDLGRANTKTQRFEADVRLRTSGKN